MTFDGNGLVFNDAATDTTNAMQYIPTYTDGKIIGEKTNIVYSGIYAEPAPLTTTPTNYIFKGWSERQDATEPIYITEQEIMEINYSADDKITLYAVWTYTTVFTFDGNGADSGAGNDYAIYYYRGILESAGDQGTYGSDSKATTYPNYVRLGNNTCWRIVRTTGSGGVKMTYNGIWNTIDSTCANVGANAQVASTAFRNPYNSAVYVGYTYNNTVAESTVAMDVNDVFDSNDNIIINNTRAPIKVLIEDTWYASAMATARHDYTSLLEAAVGYCNDRSAYDASGNLLAEIVPRENAALWFGSRVRVGNSSVLRSPSLSCPRSDVDNYVYAVGADG